MASSNFSADNSASGPWHRGLTRYHWFVLFVAALGWLFDTMDQQLFALSKTPAMQELAAPSYGVAAAKDAVVRSATLSTSIFLLGWATGGLLFGVLGDRIGRARTMIYTILIYSLFTGLSALSVGVWDFALYRFLTGLGVGGEFAVGVALVAEVMPDRARPYALGWLQALSAVGNISAALITMGLGHMQARGNLGGLSFRGQPVQSWRIVFVIGTVPALLALLIRRRLKEPERWKETAVAQRNRLGSYGELFSDPVLRKNALLGMLMAFAGVVGLWGIGFFSFDLLNGLLTKHLSSLGLSRSAIGGKVSFWVAVASIVQNVGGFLGVYTFSKVTQRIGRRSAFAIAFISAMLATAYVFWTISDRTILILGRPVYIDLLWKPAVMGFCQLSLFGGYAIYFPELFPTRLRSTGTSFCYNVGRFVAASGPAALGLLYTYVYNGYEETLQYRYAGVTMCGIFLLGLIALPFMPETKNQPLRD